MWIPKNNYKKHTNFLTNKLSVINKFLEQGASSSHTVRFVGGGQ